MVRSVDFQNEFQFHAAEIGRVRREGIFAAKLLAADLPALDLLPDSMHEFIGRGALVARKLDGFGGSGAAVFHKVRCFVQAPHPQPLSPRRGEGLGVRG